MQGIFIASRVESMQSCNMQNEKDIFLLKGFQNRYVHYIYRYIHIYCSSLLLYN